MFREMQSSGRLFSPEQHHKSRIRLMIAHSFYRIAGGEDRYVERQIELMRSSHDVYVMKRQNEDLVRGLGTAVRMSWSFQLLGELETEMKRFQPDIIHLHNAYPALGPAVIMAARRLQIPVVMTIHNQRLRCPNGLMFTQGSLCHRCEHGMYMNATLHECFQEKAQAVAYAMSLWLHRFILRLENHVALFIAPSVFMQDRLVNWGIGKNRIAMIRNFTALQPDASSELGRYGLYLGRLSDEKGLPELLGALRLAGDPPFRLVGDGPQESVLRRLAGELGLDRTRFLGRVDSRVAGRIVRSARYLVIPSLCEENAPLAALEAMAEGRPLLVTRSGGLPELVQDGTGLVSERRDVPDLAVKIRRMASDDDFCRRAGAKALGFARRELLPALHRRRLEDAYAQVAIDRANG